MTRTWQKFEDLGDQASAEVLAGRLRLDGVPAQIERISPLPGLDDRFRVSVSEALAHHARQSVASTDINQLAYLATGRLPRDDDSPSEAIVSKRIPLFGGDHLLGLLAGVFIGATVGLFLLEFPAGQIVGGIVGGTLGECLGLIVGYRRDRFRP